MPANIPLLHLPRLPFENVLKFMSLRDLIELSLLSKRMYSRIQLSQFVKHNIFRLTVRLGLYDHVVLASDQLGFFSLTHCDKDGCLIAEYMEKQSESNRYNLKIVESFSWEHHGNNFSFWVQYIKELFHFTTLSSLTLSSKKPIDRYFKETDCLLKAERIFIHGESSMSHKQLEYLLDTLVTDNLTLVVSLEDPESFQYKKKIRFAGLTLPRSLSNFSWLSEDQLLDYLTITRRIEVKESSLLTETFLNKFLKQWLNCSNDTLQEVYIWSKPYSDPSQIPVFDKKKVLEGIDKVVISDKDPKREDLEAGITISRDKNTAMTIEVTKGGNLLLLHCFTDN